MLIDSHCHLTDKRYGKSVADLIGEAKACDVNKFITIGTSIKESKAAIEIAKTFNEVYATVGVYPHEERGKEVDALEKVLEGLIDRNVVAIGECGIDISNWENGRKLEEQIDLLEMQIQLSIKKTLPLSIHNRNGNDQILKSIRKYPTSKGVIHCFTADWTFAKSVLDLGFYLSFSGIITYPSAINLVETIKNVPLDRFLVETDSPYLPPQNQRGEVNTPKNVRPVAQKVSEIKGISFEDICNLSYENTCRIFSL